MDAASLAVLERALREHLTLELGGGPETNRAAHLHARAHLVASAAAALEDQASRLAQLGERASAQALRERAAQLHEEGRELRGGAYACEGRALRSHAPERFAQIAESIAALRAQDDVRELGNQIVQAARRIGSRPAARLVGRLEREALRVGVPLPRDLLARLESFRHRVERRPPAEAPAAGDEVSELLQRAERIADEAPRMGREELRDAIEAVGARLKALEQHLDFADHPDLARRLRRAFGLLTAVSRERKPGWTPVLDAKERGRDWDAIAREAERRLELRRAEREQQRERLRREELAQALRRWREHERRVVFDEAMQRVRKHLYELQTAGLDRAQQQAIERALRAEAAVAARAARAPEEFERLARALERRQELFAVGRDFRLLRRVWGMPELAEPPAEGEDAVEAVAEAAAEALRELEEEWPEAIAATQGAGTGERVLIVGGLPSRERLEPLRKFFGWAQVEWLESYRDRQADYRALRQRLREGCFDRVVVLARFCGHDVSEGLGPVCRRLSVSYHVHPRGVSIPAFAHYIYGAGGEPTRPGRRT